MQRLIADREGGMRAAPRRVRAWLLMTNAENDYTITSYVGLYC